MIITWTTGRSWVTVFIAMHGEKPNTTGKNDIVCRIELENFGVNFEIKSINFKFKWRLLDFIEEFQQYEILKYYNSYLSCYILYACMIIVLRTFENIQIWKTTRLQPQWHSGKEKQQMRPKQPSMFLQRHREWEYEMIYCSLSLTWHLVLYFTLRWIWRYSNTMQHLYQKHSKMSLYWQVLMHKSKWNKLDIIMKRITR